MFIPFIPNAFGTYSTSRRRGSGNSSRAQTGVMLLTLPLFVAALIWLRRWRFFKWDFLRRMALLGLAGFSVYALLPLVNGLNPHSPWHFGEAWLATLKITKKTFGVLYLEFWVRHRLMTVALLRSEERRV